MSCKRRVYFIGGPLDGQSEMIDVNDYHKPPNDLGWVVPTDGSVKWPCDESAIDPNMAMTTVIYKLATPGRMFVDTAGRPDLLFPAPLVYEFESGPPH